jgi:DNA-directed RNA polymerase subunit RPC12/RpoP
MPNYYCKYCGRQASSDSSLTNIPCQRHPAGSNKGKHALYEGSEKSRYTCKNCDREFLNLIALTSSICQRHPDGPNKGRHQPAL